MSSLSFHRYCIVVYVANRTVCPPQLQNAPIKRWSPLLVGKFNRFDVARCSSDTTAEGFDVLEGCTVWIRASGSALALAAKQNELGLQP